MTHNPLQFNIAGYQIKESVWRNEEEMTTAMNSASHVIFLNEDDVDANKYISLTVESDIRRSSITLAIFGPDGKWSVWIHPLGHRMFIGYGKLVSIVNLLEFKHERDYNLVLFHRFLDVPDSEIVLVLDELGVLAISYSGDKLWEYSDDILSDVQISGSELRLSFMDGNQISISLATGKFMS